MPTITSGNITLIDLTDAKKIDVHIASNHPTVQVDDNGKYIPNWEQNNLELIATVYADSIDVTEQSKFQWKEITGIYPNEEERIFETNSNILTISDNKAFDKSSLVRYKCLVTYNEEKNNNRQFSNEITFTRINNGVSAPTVQARYSIDGNKANMEVALNPTIHKYIHFSYDGGTEWTEGVKITGKDGQSISLKGTAYTNDELVASNVVTLYSDEAKQSQITGENSGDSYLVDGYLCVYNGSQFICTGQLQGPKGEDGATYYLYIRYADSTSGSNFSDVPGNRKYVGFYRTTATQLPIDIDRSSATWNWAKFAGEDAKGITLTGNAQVFKVNKDKVVSPSKITITAQAENTAVTTWSYNTDGSTSFTNFTSSNPPTGISLLNNAVTITGSAMTSNIITIKASDGTHSDIFTVYKVSDGSDGKSGDEGKPAPIVFLTNENITFAANANGQIPQKLQAICNVVAYSGTTPVTPSVGEILSSDIPDGMTITKDSNDGKVQLTIDIEENATLGSAQNENGEIKIPIISPIDTFLSLTWSKVNSGVKGDNAPAVKAQYSANGTSDWTDSLSTSTHKYVRLSYDNGTTWSAAMKIVGDDAKSVILTANAQIFKVDKSYAVTPATITVTAQAINTTIPTSGWTYSTDGGKTFAGTVPTGVVRNGNTVTITGSTLVSNSVVIKASDGTHSDTLTVYKVLDGADAPIAFLTNENITFSANPQGQISSTTITSNIVAYNGTTKVTPTTGTITGMPTGMTITPSIVNNEIKLSIAIASNSTLGSALSNMGVVSIPITSPVNTTLYLTWSKINTGATGASIKSTTVWYGVSDSASTQPIDTVWQTTIPVVAEGKYLWTRTIIDYTDDAIPDTVTYTYAKQGSTGAKGETGSSGTSVTIKSIKYQAGTSATVAPTGTWSDSVVAVTEGNYLWTQTTFSDNKVAYGVAKQGQNGSAGTNASLVDITPSALYFKSTTGKNGTFTPDYIYLYPRFQTVTFSKWEYSVNGGTTWIAASGANGITISTYNSIANTLRIAKTSTLYTDTVTSISFRCVSSNTSVYDTVSIAKLFDVDVEEINTRITNSLAEVKTTTDSISSRVSATETSIGTINNNVSSITTRVSAAEQKITPSAIVSTVRQSTDYTNDLGKKVNSNEIISKINQTAESITISANKIGLLGATNIPDLTADKIKGGTLTLGGSNATTQNGQLLVKNASDANVVKLNKDGVIVKSGHLAVARDFTNQTYDWDTNTWTNSTNTSQLDLGDNFIRMGAYGASGYANSMTLLDDGLYFQGSAHAIGNWDSFVGHDDLGDFVIQETVRSNIYFRGAGDTEMAHISGNGLHVSGPISGGIANGNARLFTNVFVKNFPSQPTGYICVKLGSATLAQSSMITIKGHITSYHNSTSFEASCYFYNATGTFFGSVATMTNPDILREVYFAERDGYAYLILGAPNANWSYPTVAIDSLSVGYAGNTASEWTYGWDAVTYTNITSNFTKIAACTRGGINTTLWTGAILSGTTITLSENIYNFKFLTCIMGDATSPWGITMSAFMDSNVSELHFGAIYTDANSIAGANLYGVRFNINSNTSLTMQACGTKSGGGAYMRKIVGWR